MLLFSAVGALLTGMRSRSAVRELRAAMDIMKWHMAGCPEPVHDVVAESDLRWEILG